MEKFNLFIQDANEIMECSGYNIPNHHTTQLNAYLQYIMDTYGFEHAYQTQKTFLQSLKESHSFEETLEFFEHFWFANDPAELENFKKWGVEHGFI